jgi:hypothetical protein
MTASDDTRSLDSILLALYDVISGPAGERDWDRCANLFAPGARMVVLRNADAKLIHPQVMTPADYAEHAAPFFAKTAFYEIEVERKVERFGPLVHAWSSYESRHDPAEEPFDRGVNSIQVFDDGQRWWILTVTWPRTVEPVLGS